MENLGNRPEMLVKINKGSAIASNERIGESGKPCKNPSHSTPVSFGKSKKLPSPATNRMYICGSLHSSKTAFRVVHFLIEFNEMLSLFIRPSARSVTKGCSQKNKRLPTADDLIADCYLVFYSGSRCFSVRSSSNRTLSRRLERGY